MASSLNLSMHLAHAGQIEVTAKSDGGYHWVDFPGVTIFCVSGEAAENLAAALRAACGPVLPIEELEVAI
jgi:hypothetical protein